MNGNGVKALARQKIRQAAEYFKPTENVRVRDFVREVPGAVGQMFSGTRNVVTKAPKILGEGLAYATDRNVREQYKAGNTNILPTVSNTTPRQMLADTAKSAMEIAPVGKIRGLASMAMNAKLAPRLAAGGAMGYGYWVADEMSRPEPVSRDTFLGVNPIMSALAGALMGGASRPAAEMTGRSINEMANDVRNLNPANRTRHKVVGVSDMEPTGIYAAGGIPQMGENPHTYRQEVKTTVDPFNPQSYLAKVLMGKQSPMGMSIKAVDDPLLQEAGKYKSAEEFVGSKKPVFRGGTEIEGGKVSDMGISVTTDRETADFYAGSKIMTGGDKGHIPPGVGKVREYYVDPSANIFNARNAPQELLTFIKKQNAVTGKEKIVQYAKSKGYDGVEFSGLGDDEIRVFSQNNLKTKSQLTDLYNKAQGTNKK